MKDGAFSERTMPRRHALKLLTAGLGLGVAGCNINPLGRETGKTVAPATPNVNPLDDSLKPRNWPELVIPVSSSFGENKIAHLKDAQSLIYPSGEVTMLNDVLFFAPEQTPAIFTAMFYNPQAKPIPGIHPNFYLRPERVLNLIIDDPDRPFQFDPQKIVPLNWTPASNTWAVQNGQNIRTNLVESKIGKQLRSLQPEPVYDYKGPGRPEDNSPVALVIASGAVFADDLTNYDTVLRTRLVFQKDQDNSAIPA